VKLTKFIVLVGGILGIIAFFLPLIAVKDSGVEGALSAFTIVKGIDQASDVINDKAVAAAADSAEEFASQKKDANDALGAVKGVVLAIFAPALLLVVIGGVGVMRKKFGRLGGTGALLFGLIGLGIWAVLNSAANDVASDAHAGSVKGIGMYLLAVTGACGILGGLMTLVKPDRGEAAVAAR